jgi:NTP pyrophosphatase (non-canonical NTP hydrolase)
VSKSKPGRKISTRIKNHRNAGRKETGLSALQARVAKLLKDVRHPRVGAMLALMEEVGELAQLVTEREVYGQAKVEPAQLGGELADIQILLCELAEAYHLDLGQAVEGKLAVIAAKLPKWRKKYGPHLKKVRRHWD